MSIVLSSHAQKRMQQRGISQIQLDWLNRFGSERYDSSGRSWIFYDHQAKKNMQKILSNEILRQVKFDTYCVIDGTSGVFVTVGHRTKRFNRH